MKLKHETLFRAGAFIPLILLVWAVGSTAQPATNAPSRSAANAPAMTPAAAIQAPGWGTALKPANNREDYLTFGLDRIPVLKEAELLGQKLWKYVASLIYILLALFVSKLLDYVVNAWLRRWTRRTKTKLDDLLLELLHGPVKVVTFVIFLHIGLDVFGWGIVAQTYLSKGLIIVVACSLTYVALKVIDLLMGLWRQRTATGPDKGFDEQLFSLIRKSLKGFAIVVAVLVTAQHLEIKIGAMLASLSVGGLALGLAAQDTLANLFGAVAVYMDKPFRVGDRIQLDTVDGTVESIGLRSTRVRNLEGHHVTIPNKTVGNATITNVTRRTSVKTEINLGVTYDLPAEQVRRALKILEDVYRAHPNTADLTVSFNKFADSALNIQVVHWWNGTDAKPYLAGMQELNLAVKERFDAEGIGFAFPTRTLHMKQESPWRVTPAPGA